MAMCYWFTHPKLHCLFGKPNHSARTPRSNQAVHLARQSGRPTFSQNVTDSISTFSDSFPNYSSDNFLSNVLSKLHKINMNEMLEKIKAEGPIAGVMSIIKTSPIFTELALRNSDKTYTPEDIKRILTEVNDLKLRVSGNEAKLENIDALGGKIEKAFDSTVQVFQTIARNQINIDKVIDIATILSPVLVYKGLLNVYIKQYTPSDKVVISSRDQIKLMQMRQKLLFRFNCIFIPVLVGLTHWKMITSKNLNVNVNVNVDMGQNEKTSISSLPFVGLGFLGRKLYIILPVFILSMKYIILPIFKENFPLIYENILHILSVVTPYIPITLLSWVLLLTFYYLIELYLYLIICSKNENLKIPAYMPKIIQTQVNNLYEESQSNLKQEMTKYYTKNCITHIILSIISVLLYILFIL